MRINEILRKAIRENLKNSEKRDYIPIHSKGLLFTDRCLRVSDRDSLHIATKDSMIVCTRKTVVMPFLITLNQEVRKYVGEYGYKTT